MAEETPLVDNFKSSSSDDMIVLQALMHSIKGISPVSSGPFLDPL